jgi:AcrR family transcriptional regulator
MSDTTFERARGADAKQQRRQAMLDAAGALAEERSVREVTLTDIAGHIGMHKSALLRYFETREQIFLTLSGQEWQRWSAAVVAELSAQTAPSPRSIATLLTTSLTDRPLFCDLLAHTPLSLEKNVSLEAVREFKLVALSSSRRVADQIARALGLHREDAAELVTVATSMAGAMWQMAAPGSELRELYRSDPQLAHAVVDVGPRLQRIMEMMLAGLTSAQRGT